MAERCSDGVEKAKGCSRACQSVAQLDRRRLAVNPACFEGHVWKSAAGNGLSTGRVQDLWSARALLKRGSERQIDQRDATAKNGTRHVCSEHIVCRGRFEAVIRQRVGQASGRTWPRSTKGGQQ